MKLKEFDILLDIKRNKKIEYIEIIQGDYNTNKLNIKLIDGIEDYDLVGLNSEIAFSKSDGTTVLQDKNSGINVLNNKIECMLSSNTIASPGRVLAEVRVLEGTKVLTSSRFEFFVKKAIVNDETIASTNEFPILQELTDNVKGVIATEASRVTAENLRITNEIDRVTAENERVIAEDNRATTFAGYDARVTDVEDDLTTHKEDYTNHLVDNMPHLIEDLKNDIKYKYGLQLSATGQPQIIFEEVI